MSLTFTTIYGKSEIVLKSLERIYVSSNQIFVYNVMIINKKI